LKAGVDAHVRLSQQVQHLQVQPPSNTYRICWSADWLVLIMHDCQRHHPGWVHMLWDNATGTALLEQRYPWFLDTYKSINTDVLRSGEHVIAGPGVACLRTVSHLPAIVISPVASKAWPRYVRGGVTHIYIVCVQTSLHRIYSGRDEIRESYFLQTVFRFYPMRKAHIIMAGDRPCMSYVWREHVIDQLPTY
jgi:hypothetical protein